MFMPSRSTNRKPLISGLERLRKRLRAEIRKDMKTSSQLVIADAIGTHQANISAFLTGTRSLPLKMLDDLANLYDVKVYVEIK